MTKDILPPVRSKVFNAPLPLPPLGQALEEVRLGVDRFCLLAGIETLQELMEEDGTALCWPAPTSSRMRSAPSGRPAATSSASAMPRWRSAGPPRACWKPRRPSTASRPTASSPSSAPPSRRTCATRRPTALWTRSCRPHSLLNQRCLPRQVQQRTGHRPVIYCGMLATTVLSVAMGRSRPAAMQISGG